MNIIPFLETFSCVIEHGSFTSASDALGVSKSVVSKKITLLEQHLGVQLLHRTTRRLHLTQAGEVFASYTKQIMSDVLEAEQAVLPLQSEPQGKLRISVPESLAVSLLPEVLINFQQKFPKIELDIHVSGRWVDLVEEGFDIALRVGDIEDSGLNTQRLMPCKLHVCASPAYLKEYGQAKHPIELKTHNCFIYSQLPNADHWLFTDEQGKAFTIKVKGNLSSDRGNILMDSALSGKGIFIGPTFMVAKALQEGKLKAILEQYAPATTGLHALYPRSTFIPFKVRAFVDYIAASWAHLALTL